MREIKFRAWDGKRMIYPPQTDIWCVGFEGIVRRITSNNYRGLPDVILMQYTGRKQNGKDIYGGDIIKDFNEMGEQFIDVVEYNVEMSGYYLKNAQLPLNIITEKAEIIGNIHENPELL